MEEHKKHPYINHATNGQQIPNQDYSSNITPAENSYTIEMDHPNEIHRSEQTYLPNNDNNTNNNNNNNNEKNIKPFNTISASHHDEGHTTTETEDDDDDDDVDMNDLDINEDDDDDDDDNNTYINTDNETYMHDQSTTNEKHREKNEEEIINQTKQQLNSTNNNNKKVQINDTINGIQLSESFTIEEKNKSLKGDGKNGGNGEEEDEEFDWNDDPEAKLKRRRTAREKLKKRIIENPNCWHFLTPFMQRAIIIFVGCIVFVIIAVCAHYLLPLATPEQLSDPNFQNSSENLQLWMWWSTCNWFVGWGSAVIVHLVPSIVSLSTKIFTGSRSEKVKTRLIYYMSMKCYTMIFLVCCSGWATFYVLRRHIFPSVQLQSYTQVVENIFGFIFISSIFLFVQKFLMLIITTKFHCAAYEDRIEAIKYARDVLDALNKAENKKTKPVCCPGAPPPLTLEDPSEACSRNGNRPSEMRRASSMEQFTKFQKKVQSFIVTDDPQRFRKFEDKDIDVTSKKYAKKVAKKLFYALAYPYGIPHYLIKPDGKVGGTKTLEKYHFRPYFSSDEETKQAFEIFDKDGNGDITRKEFRDTVIGIYEERRVIAECIRDTSQALGKIDIILLFIFLVVDVFICMSTIFGVNLYQILLPLGTFIMGLSFMFSETVKIAFQSIMFLFVTHPYDVGDVVFIDAVRMTVFNMGISGTIFIRGDGQKVYAPTSILMTKFISNVRRSPDMGESILINVDFRTPTDLIFALRDHMDDWIKKQPRDFSTGFDIRIQDIIDCNKIVLTIWLPHKGNWQDGGRRLRRLNRFMFYLKDTLHDLGIHYELPPQQYTSHSIYDGVKNTSLVSHAYKDDYNTTRLFKNNSTSADVDGS